MRFFSFSLLIGGGALVGHLYIFTHLRRMLARRWQRTLLAILLVGMTGWFSLRRQLRLQLNEAHWELVQRFNYVWLGLLLCLTLAFAVLDLARLAGWLRARLGRTGEAALPAGTQAPAPAAGETAGPDHPTAFTTGAEEDASPGTALQRRELLTGAMGAGAAALGGVGLAGYGTWRAFHPPDVTEHALRIAKLPKTLDGLRVVQLTDIHVGPFIRRRYMDALVDRTLRLKPDLIVITGDLVDGSVRHLGDAVAALGNLQARFGTWFVTGNHEYYSGELQWVRYLDQLGIGVLRNRHVSVGDGGGSFDLIGVDDWSGGRRRGRQGYDLEQALRGRDPDRASVLLAHQPANFEVAAERGIDAQISGHTHGGQLFPMTAFIGLEWKHSAGLYRHGDASLYVSRGCGFWGPPMRIGSPPEIAQLVLTSG
ncbi:MAG TPA: metallophosphoesterase [Myxococcaceae bacterium]|nr:metallophosphoesterase [Myxococcaceae bacterium]